MKKDKAPEACNRLGKVGGQAVLEGVMMKSGDTYCVATRKPDNSIEIQTRSFTSIRKKHKFLNVPIIRGVVNFIEMMILSFKTLAISVESLGIEEEDSKFEIWLRKHFGRSIMDLVMVIATILGVLLGVGLFTLLPTLTTFGINKLTGERFEFLRTAFEGIIRIAIFVLYIWLVSLMKDIRRTFEYHGAEHKSVACYESGEDLTVENARKHSRYHPRCGTNFIFIMLILSIIIFSFVSWDNLYIRIMLKILLLPLVVGIGYEFIMFAGRKTNIITKLFCAPGLWMQRITTRDPDDSQLEIAITALKNALPKKESLVPEIVAPENTDDERAEIIRKLKNADIETPEYDASIMISEFCAAAPAEQLANPYKAYTSPSLMEAVERRTKREPLQYIIGKWSFCNETYIVSPDCLIPRADTEILVSHAAAVLPMGGRFADLCTGSGCIAISILSKRPDLFAIAADISTGALAIAKKNAIQNGVFDRIDFHELDVLAPDLNNAIGIGTLDAIVSNPPYIKSGDIASLSPELSHEPKIALDGGSDGLLFYMSILKYYNIYLKPNGFFIFEIGYDIARDVEALAKSFAYTCDTLCDYGGKPRMAIAKRRT